MAVWLETTLASIVADVYLKGLRGYDTETLWDAVKYGANAVHPKISSTGRLGFEYYNKLGYVPYDVKTQRKRRSYLGICINDDCAHVWQVVGQV